MKKAKVEVVLVILFVMSVGFVKAQSDLGVNLSGDIVSSYIWRGFKQADASVQPALSVSYKRFTLGAWGSTDITGKDKKEVDFYASYASSGFSFTVTDYWWDGEGVYRYFSSPKKGNSGHLLEVGASYVMSESFPLTVGWNTFLLGKGNEKANGDNSFSTYVELTYPFSIQNVDFKVGSGFTPWQSTVYGTDKFKVTSVLLGASKSIKITDSFQLPLFANIIANPAQEDIYFVLGITLK